MKFDREVMKGHLKTIILAVLEDGPCHAYGLNERIEEKSLGVFSFGEGTIYPTLPKMEKEGLISSEWKEREKGPKVRLYSLTPRGEKTLKDDKRDWSFFSRAMSMILEEKASKAATLL